MQMALLNRLIEGESLKTQLTLDALPVLAQQIADWQSTVEQTLQALTPPLTQEQKQSVSALMLLVDELQEVLLPIRQEIQHKQQKLFKAKAVSHAYMASGKRE